MTCLICSRIKQIKTNTNPYFVKELQTGYVVLGDFQYFEGYTLFLAKDHVTELHLLEPAVKQKFLEEFALVSEAVYKAFQPKKLNYELMGNSDPHVHWHIFPRTEHPAKPVWNIPKDTREKKISQTQMEVLKSKLLKQLP